MDLPIIVASNGDSEKVRSLGYNVWPWIDLLSESHGYLPVPLPSESGFKEADPLAIYWSSGSTGEPKGIVHSAT